MTSPAIVPPQLSIVIPAFNEAERLPRTLAAIERYLVAQRRLAEILVVDDGSSDGTSAAARRFLSTTPLRVLENPGHRGKGYSVRHGMLQARGEELLFTDADLSAPIEELEKLEVALAAGADIAIGSRSRRELIATRQSRIREWAGEVFHWIVVLTLGLRWRDTQCGFKLFRRAAAAAVFPLQRVEGWGFDPELLYVARQQGWRVAEVPVVWRHAAGAKLHLLRDSLRMFADLLSIRWHALRGHYRPPHRAEHEVAGG